MQPKKWYFVDDGFLDGSLNMARDRALFSALLSGELDGAVLRIYGFEEPAVTYGVRIKSPKNLEGYITCPRITGGGFVLHGRDLTYSVVARETDDLAFRRVSLSYERLHGAVRSAFSQLGYDVSCYHPDGAGFRNEDCFRSPVRGDLMWKGKKIAGGAQRRSRGCFLHQGSIELAPFLEEERDYVDFFERLKESILESFEFNLGVEFVIKYFDDFSVGKLLWKKSRISSNKFSPLSRPIRNTSWKPTALSSAL
jgi:lipoate-protein ligase A